MAAVSSYRKELASYRAEAYRLSNALKLAEARINKLDTQITAAKRVRIEGQDGGFTSQRQKRRAIAEVEQHLNIVTSTAVKRE